MVYLLCSRPVKEILQKSAWFVLTKLINRYKIHSIKQASLNLDLLSKKTRKQTFLDEMEKVVPWADLEALIAPYYSEGVKGRPPFALQTGGRPWKRVKTAWNGRKSVEISRDFLRIPLFEN